MKEYFRKCVNDKNKLEWQLTLVVMLALLTMAVMSNSMEKSRETATKIMPVSAAGSVGADEAEEHEGILRLHVIANSDSEEDQTLKLQVRNQVLARIQDGLANCYARELGSAVGSLDPQLLEQRRQELTRTWIGRHIEEIQGWAEEEIKARGYGYTVEASLGITWIPEKEYSDIYFPAGNYEALRIVIGEGKGQNWWCVIFPPLCLIEGCNAEEAARLEKLYGDKVILKFRILELLRS
ncbi:MAG: stage II sporulation protein R [Anaerovoracaceae bacterium]